MWTIEAVGMRNLDFLASANNVRYLYDPVPSRRDDEIRELVDSLATPDGYRELRRRVTWDEAKTLWAFAERAATLAVKQGDERLLVSGLIALNLAGFDKDEDAELLGTRESVLVVPLLFKSAKKMRVRIRGLIKAVEDVVGKERGSALRDFWNLSPFRLSLDAMGYRESETPEHALLYERIPPR